MRATINLHGVDAAKARVHDLMGGTWAVTINIEGNEASLFFQSDDAIHNQYKARAIAAAINGETE